MNWWIRSVLVAITAVSSLAGATPEFPPGLARVMSVYTDRVTGEKTLVRGYGMVIEMNFEVEPGKWRKHYVIQTVSHLSQGDYADGWLSRPFPTDGEPRPVPKLLVEVYLNAKTRTHAHHDWADPAPEFKIVNSLPLIASSYFESFRDSDLLLLDVEAAGVREIPAALRAVVPFGKTRAEYEDLDLVLPDGWRWARYGRSLVFPCPASFATCREDRALKTPKELWTVVGRRIAREGFGPAEYDRWMPFFTEEGMSGLPVFALDGEGEPVGVAGLISGTSPQSLDTWLSDFYPDVLFSRWAAAVQGFSREGRAYKVYGYGDLVWIMSGGVLSRVGENLNGLRFQESRPSEYGSAPLRCGNGSGFRLDNGSGFRLDNGDVVCSAPVTKGRNFVTQSPGEAPRATPFMIMDHPKLTLFFPPTATSLGYFFLQNNLSQIEERYQVPANERMRFRFFDGTLSEGEFARFARTIYAFNAVSGSYEAEIEVAALDKTSDAEQNLSESRGRVWLEPVYDDRRLVKAVTVGLEVPGLGTARQSVNYFGEGEHSISRLQQTWTFSQAGDVQVNLAGILTHNPEMANIPDLDVEICDAALSYRYSPGDRELKTLFTLTRGSKIFYLSVPR